MPDPTTSSEGLARETPTPRPNAHADLAVRIRNGESRAEEELFELFQRGVHVILSQLLPGRDVVEDLCQETFRLVLEKIRRGELRDPARLPGFVCNLARNLAIDLLRQEARRRTELDSEAVARTAQSSPDQLGRLLQGERARLVRRVIRELATERDREVIYRFYIAEHDKAAICADLELSALHFNRVLHRARQR